LVVEDEEDVRRATAEVLKELGYQVMVAADARSALKVLETQSRIDLLFTDIGLPNGIDGLQLAERARQRSSALKVLFTTGYAGNVEQGHPSAELNLIAKPFTQSSLADKIRGVLDGAAAGRS
jgi:CheY-like chemotaxis protein